MRLQVANSTTTVYYSVTNAVPAKPYLQISNQYLPLTTATKAGIKLKVQSGNTTYRAMEYTSSGYTYISTSTDVGNLSSTSEITYSTITTTILNTGSKSTIPDVIGYATSYSTRRSGVYTNSETRYSTSRAVNVFNTSKADIYNMSWLQPHWSLINIFYSKFTSTTSFSYNNVQMRGTLSATTYSSRNSFMMSRTTKYTDGSTTSSKISTITNSTVVGSFVFSNTNITFSITNAIKTSSYSNDNRTVSSIPVSFRVSRLTSASMGTLTGTGYIYFKKTTRTSELTCYEGYSSSSNMVWE